MEWSSGEPGCDEQIVTERDLEWTESDSPRLKAAIEFPMLDTYLDDAILTMKYRLRDSDIEPDLVVWASNVAARTAAIAALGLRKALWRDLLPRIGARDVLLSQYPLDRGPASWVPPSRCFVSTYEYYWRPTAAQCLRRRRRLPWEPHACESVLSPFNIINAIATNHNPTCLDRFPVLVRYIERQCQRVGMELGRSGASAWWVERALKPVRLIPMVAAVAMHRAIWSGLMGIRDVKASEVAGPGLFDSRSD